MPDSNLDQLIAKEFFTRNRTSVAVGVFGVAVIHYIHWDRPLEWGAVVWAALMLLVLGVRYGFALYAGRQLDRDRNPFLLINTEALLCACTGLGWGSSIYVFDNQTMDHQFYVRLMVYAAALAVTVGALGTFIRLYLAYALGLFIPVMIFLATHDEIHSSGSFLVSAFIYLPMMIYVARTGSVNFRRGVADHLSVSRLTDQLQRSLETERQLRTAMSALARTDDLTGIANRRAILDNLVTEIARCIRLGSPLAVLMIDIDHFKEINDTHGHARGDAALRFLVGILTEQLRETDVLGRFGGEEFLVVLPGLETDNAVAAAERIRESVQNASVIVGGEILTITISIGVAFYREADSADRIIARADDALYVAKRCGRNRCVSDVNVVSA